MEISGMSVSCARILLLLREWGCVLSLTACIVTMYQRTCIESYIEQYYQLATVASRQPRGQNRETSGKPFISEVVKLCADPANLALFYFTLGHRLPRLYNYSLRG